MEGWFPSSGALRYSRDDDFYKIYVEVDHSIIALARALCPVKLNTTRYAPHVSVVRREVPVNLDAWCKHEGETIPFEYSPIVYDDKKYYWLQVKSPRLTEIRLGLGLPPSSRLSRPPDDAPVFHTTIGNTK